VDLTEKLETRAEGWKSALETKNSY